MNKKIYRIKNGVPCVLPPPDALPALQEASAEDLRLLLCLASAQEGDAASLAAAAGLSPEKAESALAFWRGAGILTTRSAAETAAETATANATGIAAKTSDASREPVAPKNDVNKNLHKTAEASERNAEELAREIREGELSSLIREAEQQCGRLFNNTELSILVGLVRDYGLDGAYILTLLTYCDNVDGEKKPLRYAERVAIRLFEMGIDTYPALEEYIEKQEIFRSMEARLRRMFGIGQRRLTVREEKAFMTFTSVYGYGEEVIGAAYDVTVNATGKPSVAYAAKILAHWHEAGVKTADDAAALMARERAEGKRGKQAPASRPKDDMHSSFQSGDFFKKALERSYKK